MHFKQLESGIGIKSPWVHEDKVAFNVAFCLTIIVV